MWAVLLLIVKLILEILYQTQIYFVIFPVVFFCRQICVFTRNSCSDDSYWLSSAVIRTATFGEEEEMIYHSNDNQNMFCRIKGETIIFYLFHLRTMNAKRHHLFKKVNTDVQSKQAHLKMRVRSNCDLWKQWNYWRQIVLYKYRWAGWVALRCIAIVAAIQ